VASFWWAERVVADGEHLHAIGARRELAGGAGRRTPILAAPSRDQPTWRTTSGPGGVRATAAASHPRRRASNLGVRLVAFPPAGRLPRAGPRGPDSARRCRAGARNTAPGALGPKGGSGGDGRRTLDSGRRAPASRLQDDGSAGRPTPALWTMARKTGPGGVDPGGPASSRVPVLIEARVAGESDRRPRRNAAIRPARDRASPGARQDHPRDPQGGGGGRPKGDGPPPRPQPSAEPYQATRAIQTSHRNRPYDRDDRGRCVSRCASGSREKKGLPRCR